MSQRMRDEMVAVGGGNPDGRKRKGSTERCGEKCEITKWEYVDIPSPSIKASLSFAALKPPSALREPMSGSSGTVKCSPVANALRQGMDSVSIVRKRETIRGCHSSGGAVWLWLVRFLNPVL